MPADSKAQELRLLQGWTLPRLAQILKQQKPLHCSIHSRVVQAQSSGKM